MDPNHNFNGLNGQGHDGSDHQQQQSSSMNVDPQLHNDFGLFNWPPMNETMPEQMFQAMHQPQTHQQRVNEVVGTFEARARLIGLQLGHAGLGSREAAEGLVQEATFQLLLLSEVERVLAITSTVLGPINLWFRRWDGDNRSRRAESPSEALVKWASP
ncbi:hypothetical protein LTR09_007772 [Extremus antarcticus]|uniref:Uncharacterized protein n=1 Tax=Extremus antarcticus TaxID=702011 RepID=A0AAJ0DIT2_9PEZI|nr:hypothetical protein LTR09_007772 [Extremus antarcticus]